MPYNQTAQKSTALYDESDLSVSKLKMFDSTLVKKLKTTSGMYGNPIEISIIRKNQIRVLRSLKLGGNC